MDSEIIFQLRGDSSSTTEQNANETNDQNGDKRNVLCVIWKGNKLGAAYYNITDSLLYVYTEYIDPGPHFSVLKCLHREVHPEYTICVGSSSDTFIKALIDTINDHSPSVTTSDIRSLPPDFYILSIKEYPYDICRALLQQVDVSSFSEPDPTDALKEMYIQSLIDFDCKMSVYAAGALVKYLDKNWTFFSPEKELKIMYIHQVAIETHVLVDSTSLRAFQIFQQKSHEAGFQRGVQSNTREGLSIYKLFSSHCKSRIGQLRLRNILLNPTFDITELKKRLDFIQFALQPLHREFIESIQDNLKHILEVNGILQEIQNSKAKKRSWETLYKTIYHTIVISELSKPKRHQCVLLSELNAAISADMIGLHQSIRDAFDFSEKSKTDRPTIRFGIDSNLDAKKLQFQDIARPLTAAARLAVEELPDYLKECAITYLPEMGHLLAIKEWEPHCNPEELTQLGYKYMFTVNTVMHYKSPLCAELDIELGDINSEIVAHENRIIQRMSGYVLKHNNDIRQPLKIIALIDSLIALAKVAEERNFVKPTLNNDRIQEIKEGRHPLMDEMTGFVSNDFYSGGKHSHMKIITGPNGSGKSIYLKQIGIIIYLAHVGSYLPVKRANIGLVQSIHFRIATESASVRLSAFMIDVTQITQAIYNAKPSSLVIMDEFGKGTSGDDGVVLMVGVLRKFLRANENCPHVLVSTHYQQVSSYLPESSLLEYQKMSYTNDLVLLYKIVKGVSESFAFTIAEEVGIKPEILNRAKEIFDCLKNNKPIRPINALLRSHVIPKNNANYSLTNDMANIEISKE